MSKAVCSQLAHLVMPFTSGQMPKLLSRFFFYMYSNINWRADMFGRIADAFRAQGEKPRSGRPWNYTPPYVTARPEVTFRKLNPHTGEKLRFVVLATDGCMSN